MPALELVTFLSDRPACWDYKAASNTTILNFLQQYSGDHFTFSLSNLRWHLLVVLGTTFYRHAASGINNNVCSYYFQNNLHLFLHESFPLPFFLLFEHFLHFISQLNLWITHGFLGICSCSPWQLLMTAVKVLFVSSKDKKPSVIFLQIQILSTVKIFKVLYYCQKLLCPVSQTVLVISMGIKINISYRKPNSMSLKHDSYLHIMLFIPPRFIMTVKMISLCLTCLTSLRRE